MNLSPKAQQILDRYLKGYVTEAQLEKYRDIGVITQEEYDYIYSQKHPTEVETEVEVE